MKRQWGIVRAAAGLALVAALCAGCRAGGSASGGVIKVALEGPLTGEQASNGIDMLNGATLAVDEANHQGGVLGKRIELVSADDRADPAAGVRVATEMVSGRVFAVVGPYNSAVGVKNLQIYLKAGVIPIHLTSNSATNGQGFTVQPKDYQIAPVEAKAITGFFRAESVAIIYDPQTYTAGIASQVRQALEQDGARVVAYQRSDPGQQSYRDLLRQIESSQPDLVYVSTYYPQGGLIAKELHQTASSSICLMGLANQDPGFVVAAGLAAAGGCSYSGVPSAEQFPEAKQYVADYRARFGVAPGTWGTFTYDSAKLLFDAVRRAGSWDRAPVDKELMDITNYQGITGSITIDRKTGNRVNVPVVILTLAANGAYEVDPKWATFAGFGS